MWRLEVADWAGPTVWRWRLLDDAALVAEHAVALDPGDWQYEAFADLHGYLGWNGGSGLPEEVGDWIGRQVLGPVGPAIAGARRPVRMELPPEAAVLGLRPWELARVEGVTLAAARVRMVVTTVPRRPLPKRDVGERLRMLAVFSLPDGSGALNLRRERYELARLVREIAKVNGRAIELRVLQYGATRERLKDALLEAAGWDVVHLSGHGLPAGLILEDDTGRHDLITSTDLVELLDLASDQIKLVTLSACESAAVTAAEDLHLLGLAPRRDAAEAAGPATEGAAPLPAEAAPLPAVAAAVVARLDCAVLAMRYPVIDEFAIDLAGSFYDLLLGKEHPVAGALALSLATSTASALSRATPALFGDRAMDLTLVPPQAPPSAVIVRDGRLAECPDQPPRLVGRVGPLTRAAAALAPGSGRPAVVLHGMAGAGKTACATELAYTHAPTFPHVAWWTAPSDGDDIRAALTGFALATERQIPGLEWVDVVENAERLRDFLPRLTEILEQNRILLVIDNAESLLTEAGQWRDERWAAVIAALTAHRGLSRLVHTSRRLPAGLSDGVLVEPVHALSLTESMLLARELPGLRALIDGGGRDLAARVLRLAQGHPKLLELADGAAADPTDLSDRLDEADQLWLDRGTAVETFVRRGTAAGSDADFGSVLAGWARSAAAQIPPDALLLFQLICSIEEVDRQPSLITQTWPWIWENDGLDGPAPDPAALLTRLADHALLAPDTDSTGTVTGWRVHPGVADSVRATTDPALTERIDDTLADAWMTTLRDARTRETQQTGAWLLRAARSAAPYLHRRRRWTDLDHAADQVLTWDPSVAAAAALAPLLDRAVTATHGTDHDLDLARTHACAVLRLDPARGTTLLQDLLAIAVARERWANASSLAGDLINRYRELGHYDQALTLTDSTIDYTRLAGYGPWTQLADQAQRLQIQRQHGNVRAVLYGVEKARARMAELPTTPADLTTEVVEPWQVRENILNTGALAARDLGESERALAFNAENLISQRDRGAGPHRQAQAAFNDYGPLIQLGRLDEARDLLLGCRAAFDAADDLPMLGRTLSALADVEDKRGHPDRALDLEQQALRYTYAVGDPDAVGVSHQNLAHHLDRACDDPAVIAAHLAAAAIIAHQTGSSGLRARLTALGELLAAHPDQISTSFAEVCALVAQVPGVDLAAIVDHLPHRDGDAALQAVVAAAPAAMAEQTESIIALWAPALSALHTTVTDPGARPDAAAALDAFLAPQADTDDWRALVAALRRIQAGERDPDALLPGLDATDAAITQRALDVLAGTATVDLDAWRTVSQDPAANAASLIAAATTGDDDARAAMELELAELAADPETAALATALRHLMDGTDAIDAQLPDDQAAFLAAVQQHLAPPTPAEPPESP